MDVLAYEYILRGLKKYNEGIDKNYGNTIVATAPANPTFPLTIFDEIRNVANTGYNTCYERVSSVGYRVDVYAKTKGGLSKQTIARKLAQDIDMYLTNIGLVRISFNVSELENDGSIYHIIMTYTGNLHENRRNFI